ncbi:phage tail protein [Aeromonas sp. SCS5]|uniref:phage tail protein n=1 Tax=Aeromonas sp. SCS5 TaxID=1519205 RepID=UPI00090331D6|nr:phage tail protein [Aeromonas sp. SCS5]
MYWIDNSTGVSVPPAIPPVVSPTKLNFTDGGDGEQPSIPGAEWFNMVTDELLNILLRAGLSPIKSSHTQLADAIQLISFFAYPVGCPIPWPASAPPAGFLLMNGQSFNTSTYPILASRYPSGVLPDLRGEFIRGADLGRGVDPSRDVLSNQSDEIKSHTHSTTVTTTEETVTFGPTSVAGYVPGSSVGAFGGSETRPRNVAFNYIVRAA